MGAQLISPAGASSPHDIFPLPLFGQYVTPGATNINTYCNSMIGARGNNEGPVGVRMAAITGKTPEYGYLLDENRYARTVVDVQVEPVNYIEWAVLGFYISKRLSTHYWDVPVLTGINPLGVTSDDIMSFCASMNNPGSLTHFLIEGLSPEGKTLEQALGTNKPLEKFSPSDPRQMKEIYDTYPPTGNTPEIVTIRFPLTVQRLYEVARLFEGKKVHKDVAFSVDLTVSAKLVAEKFGLRRNRGIGRPRRRDAGAGEVEREDNGSLGGCEAAGDQNDGDRQSQRLQRHRPAGGRHGPSADDLKDHRSRNHRKAGGVTDGKDHTQGA